MYDASLEDMVRFEEQLLQVATFYIRKTEHDFDFDKFEFALVDRIEVLSDLLELELEYQFLKAQLLLAYLDAFEHTCDPLTQQRLMQIIVDIMAWKPKLDYQRSWYFRECYKAEARYLQSLLVLLRDVIAFQMQHERSENRKVLEYLNASYKAADAYTNMSWSDAHPTQIKTEIEDRKYVQHGMRDQGPQAASSNAGAEKPADTILSSQRADKADLGMAQSSISSLKRSSTILPAEAGGNTMPKGVPKGAIQAAGADAI